MNIVILLSQIAARANRRLPVGRMACAAGRKPPRGGTRNTADRYTLAMANDETPHVSDDGKKHKKHPAAVISADPEPELERRLKRNPDDLDARADVGSDESMDASDPPSSSQPGAKDEPVPSSGFPD
ncbi:MAG TPA: hypothetical protein VFP57_10175 [Sphingomicrobium sp.]|jgi:hypothetical protein|nr:hypothetical protein [Sphingomicrobium sp.]